MEGKFLMGLNILWLVIKLNSQLLECLNLSDHECFRRYFLVMVDLLNKYVNCSHKLWISGLLGQRVRAGPVVLLRRRRDVRMPPRIQARRRR